MKYSEEMYIGSQMCVLKNPNVCEIMQLINRDKAKEPIQFGDDDKPMLCLSIL